MRKAHVFLKPLLITLALFGAVIAPAQADLLPQATSPTTLAVARGLIWDASTDDWVFDGEWALRCRQGACAEVALGNVDFDLAITMVRPTGGESHSHSFTNFVATAVAVFGDDLIIDGTIERGTLSTAVQITIADIAGRGTITIDLIDDNHVIDPISGVATQSR